MANGTRILIGYPKAVSVSRADAPKRVVFYGTHIKHSDGTISEDDYRCEHVQRLLAPGPLRIRPHTIWELQGADTSDPDKVTYERIRGPVDDPDLAAIASELQKPQTIEHPVFGTLTLDTRYGWFETRTVYADHHVRVSLSAKTASRAETLRDRLDELGENFGQLVDAAKSDAADEMLQTAREWAEEKPGILTRQAFKDAMNLTDASIAEDGGMDFYFDDGDLFWGHTIYVSYEPDGTLRDASFHG